MLKNIKRVLFAGLIALGAIGLTGCERPPCLRVTLA